jgi:hypothetical protein
MLFRRSRARNKRPFTAPTSAPVISAISLRLRPSYSKRTSASRCSGARLNTALRTSAASSSSSNFRNGWCRGESSGSSVISSSLVSRPMLRKCFNARFLAAANKYVLKDARSGRKFSGFRIKLRKQSCVTSSAISTSPSNRYAKRKIGCRCRSYNSRKAAWSPSPAFLSKTSSVVLSGNQALDPAGTDSCCSYRDPEKSYGG